MEDEQEFQKCSKLENTWLHHKKNNRLNQYNCVPLESTVVLLYYKHLHDEMHLFFA